MAGNGIYFEDAITVGAGRVSPWLRVQSLDVLEEEEQDGNPACSTLVS